MSADKRKNVRAAFETRVTLTPLDGQGSITSTSTRDISLKGVYCYSPITLPQGTRCKIFIELLGAEEPLRVEVIGHVIREDDQGMALFFDEIDLESFQHLKNILYYNTGDPDRIDHEILHPDEN